MLRDAVLVALIAAVVRLLYSQAVPFPPADDPAYYATVARNLVAGRGFVSDVIWQYGTLYPSVTHAAGDLWMPLPSLVMAASIWLAGSGWFNLQIPGIVAGSGLAALTYRIGRDVFTSVPGARALAWSAALLVALNGVLSYQSVSGDSSALFALLVAVALWLAGRAFAAGMLAGGRAALTAAAAGLALGLAYLARSDALFLAPALAGAVVCRALSRRPWADEARWLGLAFAVSAAVVLPWLARNVAEFGAASPVPIVRLASLTSYDTLFDFPSSGLAAVPPSIRELIDLRIRALWFCWQSVLGFMFFPSALLPIAGLIVARRRPGMTLAASALVLTLASTALLFPVPAMAGTFYHDAGAFAPWLAVGSVFILKEGTAFVSAHRRWKRDLLWAPVVALLGLTVGQLALTANAVSTQHRGEMALALSAGEWLNGSHVAVAMSNKPYNLDYAASQPGIMLPASQPPASALAAARRYSASVLVVIGSAGLYPGALEDAPICGMPDADRQPFCRAHDGPGWQAFEIK